MKSFYRIAVVRDGVRRVIDVEATEAQDLGQGGHASGWVANRLRGSRNDDRPTV